ncbi:MAG: YihA family ribosome biogenesis GTP-binding protein [Bacteroidaceae bacterium]|nr:YihA family ribosome biogenesis GTP-binding protein [Bacteroidaceae bacterium]
MTIKSAEYLISSAKVGQCPGHESTEYAFIGRSNVGKSSLINMLTGYSKLAKTSSMPGKTMLINHFLINKEWYLVDLPGYGFAKRSKKAQDELEEMISSYILERELMTNLFVLIDVRHKPQRIDVEFMEWLGENGIPFSIIFTKADKLSKSKLTINVETYKQKLLETWAELPPIFVTSAEKGLGEAEVIAYIEGINRDLTNRG